MISDVEHLFMYLQAISISPLKKCLFRSSASWIVWFFCCWIKWVLYIFWILTLYQIYDLQIFSPIPYITFSFCLWFFFTLQKLFWFDVFIFAFGVKSKKSLPRLMLKSLPPVSSRNLMVSGLTVRYLIHFELIFVCGVRCVHAKSLQLCPALCDPVDHSLPGSSVHGILQARMLEWFAISFFKGSYQPRGQTSISYFYWIGEQVLWPLVPPGIVVQFHLFTYGCLVFSVSFIEDKYIIEDNISSWFSLGRLYVSRHLFISFRLSNLLAYNCL